MEKTIKEIRDQKLDEMVKSVYEYDVKLRDLVKNGEKEYLDVGKGKKIVIHKGLSKLVDEQTEYIKDSLKYLLENCSMSRRDVMNRLRYMEKKGLGKSWWSGSEYF